MFSYYGSKSKIVHLYPSPKFDKIIEPFAGSARYSLKYWDRDVILIDNYEVIIRVWKWLQQASKKDILSLPDTEPGETINRDDFDCIEQAWLMGFMINAGSAAPKLTTSPIGNFGGGVSSQKRFIAKNLDKIRHWDIRLGEYRDISNQQVTWFIDPPYQFGGEYYTKSNKDIDYAQLASWCKSRKGQTIVCENTKANWLPFWPMKELHGQKNTTVEAIWSNMKHDFMRRQLPLFSNL